MICARSDCPVSTITASRAVAARYAYEQAPGTRHIPWGGPQGSGFGRVDQRNLVAGGEPGSSENDEDASLTRERNPRRIAFPLTSDRPSASLAMFFVDTSFRSAPRL
jgi:hypothetical protein